VPGGSGRESPSLLQVAPPGFIQTVSGPVAPADLGAVDAHTHLLRNAGPLVDQDPSFLLSSREKAVEELKLFRKSGGGCVVEMTPTGPGRDPEGLADVSRRAGIHVVAATGFAPWALYPGSELETAPLDRLTELIVEEVGVGMDAGNGVGPIRRLPCRAGVIKATVNEKLSQVEEIFVRAALMAHAMTGAPVSVHTEKGRGGGRLLKMIGKYGVEPEAVILAHVLLDPDDGNLLGLASSGAYLILDGMGKPRYGPDSRIINRIEKLLTAGFEEQLLLGTDLSKSSYWKSCGGVPGFDYLLSEFVPTLKERGIPRLTIDQMVRRNPGRAFRMRTVSYARSRQ
jgi:5-phospho-D-xylono-1,4-lactonase